MVLVCSIFSAATFFLMFWSSHFIVRGSSLNHIMTNDIYPMTLLWFVFFTSNWLHQYGRNSNSAAAAGFNFQLDYSAMPTKSATKTTTLFIHLLYSVYIIVYLLTNFKLYILWCCNHHYDSRRPLYQWQMTSLAFIFMGEPQLFIRKLGAISKLDDIVNMGLDSGYSNILYTIFDQWWLKQNLKNDKKQTLDKM